LGSWPLPISLVGCLILRPFGLLAPSGSLFPQLSFEFAAYLEANFFFSIVSLFRDFPSLQPAELPPFTSHTHRTPFHPYFKDLSTVPAFAAADVTDVVSHIRVLRSLSLPHQIQFLNTCAFGRSHSEPGTRPFVEH